MNTTSRNIDGVICLAVRGAFTYLESNDITNAKKWLAMANRRAITLYGASDLVPAETRRIVRDIVKFEYPVLLNMPIHLMIIGNTLGLWGQE